MKQNIVETVVGAVVLIIAVIFALFAYGTAQIHHVAGYSVSAHFHRIEGIREGGDVRISGIKVGSILGERLDPSNFDAVVTMSIDPAVKLPKDTVAEISSAGLLGDKFLELVPGNDDKLIAAGGVITNTQSAVSLESLLAQVVYSVSGSGSAGGAAKGEEAKP